MGMNGQRLSYHAILLASQLPMAPRRVYSLGSKFDVGDVISRERQ